MVLNSEKYLIVILKASSLVMNFESKASPGQDSAEWVTTKLDYGLDSIMDHKEDAETIFYSVL